MARTSPSFAPAATAAFPRDAFFMIAGPCQLEDDALNLRVAEHLARLSERVPGGIVFKASFDKANRSNPGATRGPGLEAGLSALQRVKAATGMRILTDVHLPEQCAPAAEVVDVLQIPAFLCRQTDLLEAAGATGKPVNVKKGQWMQPEGMRGAVRKVRGAANGEIEVAVTERGSFFGYGDLVVDMRGFMRMRAACDSAVIFDGTHSVQQPGRGEALAVSTAGVLRSAVGMMHAARRWPTAVERRIERRQGQAGIQDRAERIPDDFPRPGIKQHREVQELPSDADIR
jgi:2-dehydro-3-deoxyphosphooctonate aldolase (KDO 8-P synthase)